MKQSNVIFKTLYLLLSCTLLVSMPVMSDPLYGKTAFDDIDNTKALPAIQKQSTDPIEGKALEAKSLAKKTHKEPTKKQPEKQQWQSN